VFARIIDGILNTALYQTRLSAIIGFLFWIGTWGRSGFEIIRLDPSNLVALQPREIREKTDGVLREERVPRFPCSDLGRSFVVPCRRCINIGLRHVGVFLS